MGHMYPEKQATMLLRRIYAKGFARIGDLVKESVEKKLEVSCAEGGYEDEGMLCMAFENCITEYTQQDMVTKPVLVPDFENDEQRKALKAWVNCELADADMEDEQLKAFMQIKWRFGPKMRKAYIDKKIAILDYVCH